MPDTLSKRDRTIKWLSRIGVLENMIKSDRQEIERLRYELHSHTSSLSHASGGGSHDWTELSVRIIDMERRVREHILQLTRSRQEIYDAIMKVEPEDCCLLLDRRYLKQESWTKIAQFMHCDRTTCWRMHLMALEKVEIPESCNTMQHSL